MDQTPFKVLVFSKTQGFRHESIPAGVAALRNLSDASQTSSAPFSVEATEDSEVFSPDVLKQYRVLVFLQASGNFLDNEQQLDALKGYVRGGGGIVGIHCASTGMPSSEWYGRLIGGVFTQHPEPQVGRIEAEDPNHPVLLHEAASKDLSNSESIRDPVAKDWFDEWYNFRANPRVNKVHVLWSVKESSYDGGTLGDDHPITWCHEFEGARSFYTGLGHFDEAYQDDWFMKQISNAILWTGRYL